MMAMTMEQLLIGRAVVSSKTAWDEVIHFPRLSIHEIPVAPGATSLLSLQ
jgi:hypothetical protein